jgi:hypothetical protein
VPEGCSMAADTSKMYTTLREDPKVQ